MLDWGITHLHYFENEFCCSTDCGQVFVTWVKFLYLFLQTDPLRKVMVAFAAKLNSPLDKLKFTFDGAVVEEHHTPENLDMEDDDCIDAENAPA